MAPFTVLVGWLVDKPLTLIFSPFETGFLILSVVVVSICLSHPKTNWLEGAALLSIYLMGATGFWFENMEE